MKSYVHIYLLPFITLFYYCTLMLPSDIFNKCIYIHKLVATIKHKDNKETLKENKKSHIRAITNSIRQF